MPTMADTTNYATAFRCARGSRQRDLGSALVSEEGMDTYVPTAMGISKSQQAKPGRCASAKASWEGLVTRLEAAGYVVVTASSGPRGGKRYHLSTLTAEYPHLSDHAISTVIALKPDWLGTLDALVEAAEAAASDPAAQVPEKLASVRGSPT